MKLKVAKRFLCNLIFTFALFGLIHPQSVNISQSGIGEISPVSNEVILLGDTQETSIWEFWRESNKGIRKIVLEKVTEENPDFLILLGDMVFNGSSADEWKRFNDDAFFLRKAELKIFPVRGNHEYFGNNSDAVKNFEAQFPFLNGRSWYAIRTDNTAFILLNSNFNELSEQEKSEQQIWYKKTLEQFNEDSTISGVIVCAHHPPFTNSTVVESDENVKKYFVVGFEKYAKCKMFFSGHCHSYEHFKIEGKDYVVSGGGGGPRQELDTTDSKKYNDQFYGSKIRPFNFCKLYLSGSGIKAEVWFYDPANDSWETGDTFELKY